MTPPTAATPKKARVPLLAKGRSVDWWFVSELNSATNYVEAFRQATQLLEQNGIAMTQHVDHFLGQATRHLR